MAHEAAKLVTAVNEAKENGGHLGSRSFHFSISISDGFGRVIILGIFRSLRLSAYANTRCSLLHDEEH